MYPAGHAIIEGYRTGQAWFPFGESMLTTADTLLFLQLLKDDSRMSSSITFPGMEVRLTGL